MKDPSTLSGYGIVDSINSLSDVDTSGEAKNMVLKYNGNNWVPAVYNASFTFSVATFTSNIVSTTNIIGATGIWKNIGDISFSATYNNGPAISGYITIVDWTTLTMSGVGYVGPTLNKQSLNYPTVDSYKQFVLHATDGTDISLAYLTYYFYNYCFWGTSTKANSYIKSDIEGLAGSQLTAGRALTFTVTAGASDYIMYSYPKRYGTATFTVNGFSGGFEEPETVSVTNVNGYVEDYYIYRSTHTNLGTTTVVVT